MLLGGWRGRGPGHAVGTNRFSEERLTVTDASPTVRQRELGLRLRKTRTGLGLTVEDVARKLMCSPAKVSRMETGARRPILRDIRELCSIYSLNEKAFDEAMHLPPHSHDPASPNKPDQIHLVPSTSLDQ